jgi:AraC-like DNA-binding protein
MATALASGPALDWFLIWVGRSQLVADAPLERRPSDIAALITECPENLEPPRQLVVRHVLGRALSDLVVAAGIESDPHVMDALLALMKSPASGFRWRDSLLRAAESCAEALASRRDPGQTIDRSLLQILDVIDARFRDPGICLSALAREAQLSPWHVVRLLRTHTGQGFVGHLRQRRVAEAGRLLKETRLNGKQIAAEVGYRHARQLSRDFRQVWSVTPTEFRRSLLPQFATAMARINPSTTRKGRR